MWHEYSSVEEIHQRQQELEQELTKLMCTLNNMAAEGAMITRPDVMEARNSFGMAQYEQRVRLYQLEEFKHSGSFEGSLMRGIEFVGGQD